MKKIVKDIVRGAALVALLLILIMLAVSGAKAAERTGERQVERRIEKYGPVGVDGSVLINVLELTEVGDSLLLAFDVRVNRRAMNNRQSWRIVPELNLPEPGQYLEFPTVLITGRQKERHFKRKERFDNNWLMANYPDHKATVAKGTDTTIHYRVTVPYERWMDNARLSVRQYLASPKEKRQLFSLDGYRKVSLEPRIPYIVRPRVSFITPEKESKHRSEIYRSHVDFPVNVSRIIPAYRRNPEELATIDRQWTLLKENPYIDIEAVFMEGYASPEGSREVNERLALERVEALKNYFVTNHGINAGIISTASVTEDWDGLRSVVDGWPDGIDKDRIMAVIDSSDTPDTKERRLRALSPLWVRLVNEVFPLLRRTEYRIDFKVSDFTVEQSRSLFNRHPELFSYYEIYKLAMSYGNDTLKRLEVLEKAVAYFPGSDLALNNYAAALIEAGEYPAARRYLQRIADRTVAANNLGILYLVEGNYEKAEECFKTSPAEESAYNLEQLRLKVEDDVKMGRYKHRQRGFADIPD